MTDWIEAIRGGHRRTLAKLLTKIENQTPEAEAYLAQLQPHTGQAHIIGITGAPGTGKSTLLAALAKAYRQQGQTVGVLAVDPSSPFSGGALLGDRVRMDALSGDEGVFIRSMAARGQLGGLARTTRDAAQVLDAAGFNMIFIETVGAGQSEVDVVRAAHTTLVVMAPGLGDGVQAIKAGILEIADVLVVNKADLPGAANTFRALRSMLDLGHPTKPMFTGHHPGFMAGSTVPPGEAAWHPPILETSAVSSLGLPDLIRHIDDHYQHLSKYNILTEQARQVVEDDLESRLKIALFDEFFQQLPASEWEQLIQQIMSRQVSPSTAVQHLLATHNQNSAR